MITQPLNPNKSSRNIDDLIMPVKLKALNFVHACKEQGIDVLITCTYRCPADQNQLYEQGRSLPGRIVTNAKAGDSAHQYRIAFDVVPMRNGKPVWGIAKKEDLELWQSVGEIGESCGLEWAGRWTKFREFPHFQYLGGLSFADLKAGKLPQ